MTHLQAGNCLFTLWPAAVSIHFWSQCSHIQMRWRTTGEWLALAFDRLPANGTSAAVGHLNGTSVPCHHHWDSPAIVAHSLTANPKCSSSGPFFDCPHTCMNQLPEKWMSLRRPHDCEYFKARVIFVVSKGRRTVISFRSSLLIIWLHSLLPWLTKRTEGQRVVTKWQQSISNVWMYFVWMRRKKASIGLVCGGDDGKQLAEASQSFACQFRRTRQTITIFQDTKLKLSCRQRIYMNLMVTNWALAACWNISNIKKQKNIGKLFESTSPAHWTSRHSNFRFWNTRTKKK